MKDSFLVSIITPVFNSSKTIEETYLSIQSQTYSNWEWIVVNDCSTDNTLEVVKKLVVDDKRIKVVSLKENSGAAVARNKGIELAQGRFIAFLDSDDLWKKDKLEHQISFMLNNNYSFTYTDYYIFFPEGKRKMYKSKKKFVTYKSLLYSNMIGCLTVMYDASIIGKQYMPLDAEKREDHAAWLDLVKLSKKAFRLDEVLSEYRVGNTSVSSNKFKMIKYQYRLYRIHEKFNPFKSLWYTFCIMFNKVFRKYIY